MRASRRPVTSEQRGKSMELTRRHVVRRTSSANGAADNLGPERGISRGLGCQRGGAGGEGRGQGQGELLRLTAD